MATPIAMATLIGMVIATTVTGSIDIAIVGDVYTGVSIDAPDTGTDTGIVGIVGIERESCYA
jgi:hypothetical protein